MVNFEEILKSTLQESGNYTHEELQKMLAHPSILPQASDQSYAAWLYRLSLIWGQVSIFLTDLENGVKDKLITQDKFMEIIGDEESLKLHGMFKIEQVAVNKLIFSRKELAYDGKYYTKKLVVGIRLKSNLLNNLKDLNYAEAFSWFFKR